MDGIKKKSPTLPAPTETPIQNSVPTSYFQKKEELYISHEENSAIEKTKEPCQSGQLLRKILWTLFFLILLTILSFCTFFLWKAYATSKKINSSAAQTTLSQDMKSILSPIMPQTDKFNLKGEAEGRINILLLGAAGENKPGGNLTDTVMVMSIDTKSQKVALLSLPRDFYVPIGETNAFTKINSLYKIGIAQEKDVELVKQAVEKVAGIAISYHVVVDFTAFEKIIDDINGINIMVERDIYDPTYPGPNYSYELFAIKKGAHLVDGNTALKYVRERHDDPEGDFGRAKRQQQVIQAVKSRIFSMQTMFNVVALNKILDTLGSNIKTDMTFEEIEQFIKLSKLVDTQNINNVVIDAWKTDSLLKVSHVMVGNDRAFILVPRVGNYSEIKDLAQNIFNQDELKKRQAAILQEAASIVIINRSTDSQLASKIKKLLSEKLNMKDVHIISDNATETTNQTTVTASENTEKIFTLDELIKKLPAALTANPALLLDTQEKDKSSDITITLGNDLVELYKYEEDSMDDLNNNSSNQENFDFTKVIN